MNFARPLDTRGHGVLVAALVAVALSSQGCGEKVFSSDRLIADARQARDRGNNNAAIIHLKNLLQRFPEHAEARYMLGVAYADKGDFVYAEKELRRALDLRYDRAKVIPLLGRSLLAMGEFQKVLEQVPLERETGNQLQAEVLTLRALASIGLGRGGEGRELLEKALGARPDYVDALLGLARLAATEKNVEEASRLVERAIASAPKSADVWLMKGDLSRNIGEWNAAATAYQKAIEFSPNNILARVSIALLQIDSGNFDGARQQLEQMSRIAPNNPIVKFVEGLVEFRQHNYVAAREAARQVLNVIPNHVPSMVLAGAVEHAMGSHTEAQWHLGRAIYRTPDDPYPRRLLIASLAKTGQVQRALDMLQPMLKQFPDDGPLMMLAGEVYLQSNELPKAAHFFEKAAMLDPRSAGARTGLGLSRLASGKIDDALADLNLASQLDSDGYQADILMVTLRLRQANYDEALKAMQVLERKQPNNPLTYNLKAMIYIGKNDATAARRYLERALELQPTYVPAAVNLAQLDLQEKNPRAARRRLEVIVDKDKDNVQALVALASLDSRIGATQKERIDWLERASKANPGSVQPLIMLSRIHAQAGDVKKALEIARKAYSVMPDHIEVLDTLGAIQTAAGRKDQALATYRKLATLQPKSPVALHRLATMQTANGDDVSASATLREALVLKPDFVDAEVALAEVETRAGRYSEAMRIAHEVQRRTANSPLGFVLEGDVLMAQKKFGQAVNAYEAAFAIKKSGMIAVRLHAAYAQAGKPDEAEARLAKWLKESPEDGGVRLYAADTSLKRGQYRSAIEHYEWFQKKQPDNALVLNNLAWAYQQVKDARALETAERGYQLAPDNPAIADTLGWILVERGNTGRGLGLLQKAVSAAPEAQEIRYHLARGWLKSGDRSKARKELEIVLTAEPTFSRRAEAMSLLEELKN